MANGNIFYPWQSDRPSSIKWVSWTALLDADVLLYLRTRLVDRNRKLFKCWIPFTAPLAGRHTPLFLQRSVRVHHAEQLVRLLGVDDIETLRSMLATAREEVKGMFRDIHFFHGVFPDFDVHSVGSNA